MTDSPPLVHVISHPQDTIGQQITEHVAQALEYAKIRYEVQNIARDSSLEIPLTAQTVLLATSQLQRVDSLQIERLVQFVNEGNNLIIPRPVWDDRMMFLQGMKADAILQNDTTATGFFFREEVFPGFQGIEDTLVTGSTHQGFASTAFKQDVSVIATAENNTDYPVILRNNIGGGSVYIVNSYQFSDWSYRGLLFSILLRSLPGVPYEVGNVSTIFLDDFPAPVYDERMETIATEMDITQAEFVYDVWWPDMKALADSLDLTYTAAMVFNYNSKLMPPFTFEEWKLGKAEVDGDSVFVTSALAQDVADSRHELGFHGYNHYSLLMEDWESQRNMTLSVEAANRMWFVQQLGESPVTYVPPQNNIDSAGIRSLQKGMPSIKYIASLSEGTMEEGGGREFGPDPYNPFFYNYPRHTSGFQDNNNSRLRQNGSLLLTGIWSHFVHPDDVFDISEDGLAIFEEFGTRNPNNLGWRNGLGRGEYGLYDLFVQRLKETRQTYPMLRFEAVKTAAPKVQEYRNRRYQRSFTEKQFMTRQLAPDGQIAEAAPLRYWHMYVPEPYSEQAEAKLKEISADYYRAPYWDGYLYQFSTSAPVISFPHMEPDRGGSNRLTVDELSREVRNFETERALSTNFGIEYTPENLDSLNMEYARNPESAELMNQVIRLSIGTNNTDRAISVLEEKVLTDQATDSMSVERLLTFYGWQGRTADAWELLENRWTMHPNDATLQLKNRIVDQFGWPDYQTQLKWLRREYQTHPESTETIRNVVRSFTADTSWNRITKEALNRLIAKEPRSDTLYAYKLQRSFWYDSTDTTLNVADELPAHACEQVRPFAEDLAYMYAGERGNLETATQWADRAFHFDPAIRLQWLLDQGQMEEFYHQSLQFLQRYPAIDSLRTFIGETLFYEGYDQEAYDILYPLFFDQRRDSVEYDLEAEMSFLSYEQQKQMYRRYPAMFTDSLRGDLNRRYQNRESFSVVAEASHQDDNFNNRVTRTGMGAEWGNTNGNLHRVNLSRIFVGSTVNQRDLSGQLYQADYNFTHTFSSQQLQASGGGGVQYRRSDTFPYVSAGISYFDSLSFNSLELQYQPVLTNTAIDQGIKRLQGTFYREDIWLRERLRTVFSGRGRYFTDNVFSYEGGLTLFIWPQTFGYFSATPVVSGSFGSATENRASGVPYFTPDNLITRGAGLNLAYQVPGSDINIDLQLQMNRDNDTGMFSSGTATVSTPLTNYLNFQLQASLSNSNVYQSNNIGFTLHFDLPNELTPSERHLPAGSRAFGSVSSPSVIPDRDGNAQKENQQESFKIIGTISYPDTAVYTSLYDHPIRYQSEDGQVNGTVRSYFTGDFVIEDLPAGRYSLWLPETDEFREVQPDTLTAVLDSGLEDRVLTDVNFNLQPEPPAQPAPVAAQDTLQYYVVLNYTDSLAQAISLVQRDQSRLEQTLSLYYEQSRNLIHIGSNLFSELEEAEQFYNRVSEQLDFSPFAIETLEQADTTVTRVNYRFQFGSFKRLGNARNFLESLQSKTDEMEVRIDVDPVLGLFEIVTDEYTDWEQTDIRLRRLESMVGENEVFRDIEPAINP